MEKITSFTVNHDKIIPGIYVSRIDGDITTYMKGDELDEKNDL